jgi:hypothetical protein
VGGLDRDGDVGAKRNCRRKKRTRRESHPWSKEEKREIKIAIITKWMNQSTKDGSNLSFSLTLSSSDCLEM